METACPLKVLHVASGDLWAGAEAQLFTLARALQRSLGASVCVVLLNHGELERKLHENAIQVIVLDESKLNGLQILYRLVGILREQKPDVVHTHRIKENILGSIAARFSGNIPTLRTAHGASEHRPSWRQIAKRLINTLDGFCGRFLQQRIIAVSEDLAGLLKTDFPAQRIRVIENGIDLESLGQQKNGAIDVAKNGSSRLLRIGLAGRLVPVKRADLFIRTARHLLDHDPELQASFHIFGDGPLRAELEALSRELQTTDVLHFEGHCDEIHQALRQLDVLVMTSDHEGLPMILLEAMALQTPIIAHAVGGIPRLLEQGECGVLVADHSPAGYAREIRKLAQDPQMQAELSRKALQRVQKHYSAERNARDYCAIYAEIR